MSDYRVKRITQVVDRTGFTVAYIHSAKYCMTEVFTSKGMSKPIPIIE